MTESVGPSLLRSPPSSARGRARLSALRTASSLRAAAARTKDELSGVVIGACITARQSKIVCPLPHHESLLRLVGAVNCLNHSVLFCRQVWYSDDQGLSYNLSATVFQSQDECTLAELSDGTVYLNMRNTKHHRGVATSSNGGASFGALSYDAALPSPVCQATLSTAGGHLLFANPATILGRTTGTIKKSLDNGKSWSSRLEITPKGVSYDYSCLNPEPMKDDPSQGGLLWSHDGAIKSFGGSENSTATAGDGWLMLFSRFPLSGSMWKPTMMKHDDDVWPNFNGVNSPLKNSVGKYVKTADKVIAVNGGMAAAPPTPPVKPHVLFVISDDLRPQLGAYGTQAITPNIDALSKCGTTFSRAYTQFPWCSPTRQSFMTGRRPDSTKAWTFTTSFRDALPNATSLPQHFRQQGWYALSVGKIYHGLNCVRGDPGCCPANSTLLECVQQPTDADWAGGSWVSYILKQWPCCARLSEAC